MYLFRYNDLYADFNSPININEISLLLVYGKEVFDIKIGPHVLIFIFVSLFYYSLSVLLNIDINQFLLKNSSVPDIILYSNLYIFLYNSHNIKKSSSNCSSGSNANIVILLRNVLNNNSGNILIPILSNNYDGSKQTVTSKLSILLRIFEKKSC